MSAFALLPHSLPEAARGGGRTPPRSERAQALRLRPGALLPANVVALLTDILSDETARAPAFGLDNALRLPFPVAAKTGTSHAFVDNWTVGFTAERTVAVWAGSFDGRPMTGVPGIAGAAPIFSRILARSMRGIAPRPLVDRARFDHARVCALSGDLAGRECPSTVEEVFLPGTRRAPRMAGSSHDLTSRAMTRAERLSWSAWRETASPSRRLFGGPLRALPEHVGSDLPADARSGAWEKHGIHGAALEAEEHAKARADVVRRVRAMTGELLAA